MAISVADNFSYQGGKPLDARMKFDTVALMVATPAASLYDGCFAYVKATKKYYSYDSANETDPTLGKWVEYSSGDAPEYDDFTGATSEAAGVHGLVPAPAIADREKFLKGDGTWADVPLPSFDYSNTSPEAMNFSTDEKVIGTWVDGKPLYQKTYDLGGVVNVSYTGWTTLVANVTNLNIDKLVNASCFNGYTSVFPVAVSYRDNTALKARSLVNKDAEEGYSYIGMVTIRYTKTADTAVASGEKIIGQWIDGKPLYQKSFTIISPWEIPSGTWTSLPNTSIQNVRAICSGEACGEDGVYWGLVSFRYTDNSIQLYHNRSSIFIKYVIVRYTKTTD